MPDEEDSSKNDPSKKETKQEAGKKATEAEILENLPEEVKKVVEIGFSMQRFGPVPSPLLAKVTEQHITKMIDIIEKDGGERFL